MLYDTSFRDFVTEDLLGDFQNITSRAMFGGYGIYKSGVIFAVIIDGTLYFKVDDNNMGDYEQYGSKPFRYESKGKTVTMSYWELPEEIMEDKEKLEEWVEKSVRASDKDA